MCVLEGCLHSCSWAAYKAFCCPFCLLSSLNLVANRPRGKERGPLQGMYSSRKLVWNPHLQQGKRKTERKACIWIWIEMQQFVVARQVLCTELHSFFILSWDQISPTWPWTSDPPASSQSVWDSRYAPPQPGGIRCILKRPGIIVYWSCTAVPPCGFLWCWGWNPSTQEDGQGSGSYLTKGVWGQWSTWDPICWGWGGSSFTGPWVCVHMDSVK